MVLSTAGRRPKPRHRNPRKRMPARPRPIRLRPIRQSPIRPYRQTLRNGMLGRLIRQLALHRRMKGRPRKVLMSHRMFALQSSARIANRSMGAIACRPALQRAPTRGPVACAARISRRAVMGVGGSSVFRGRPNRCRPNRCEPHCKSLCRHRKGLCQSANSSFQWLEGLGAHER